MGISEVVWLGLPDQGLEDCSEFREKLVRQIRTHKPHTIVTVDPARPRPGLPTLEEAVEAGSWLCGPPDLIIEKLADVQDRFPGLDAVNIGNVIGTPQSVVLEQLEWFAKEVMPAFKGKVEAPALAD